MSRLHTFSLKAQVAKQSPLFQPSALVCRAVLAIIAAFVLPAQAIAAAVQRDNQVVSHVGAHSNYSTAFFRVKAGVPDCLYDTIYVDLNTQGGRAAYANLLSAKRSEAVLPWFTYNVRTDGTCLLDTLSG